MKSRRIILRLFFCALILATISFGLCLTPRSTANPSGNPFIQEPKGTIIAQLKYDPAVHGYGSRNYGRDHDNENDLNDGNLIMIFGAENVCETGTTASDCVLNEPAEEWLAEAIKLLAGGHCEGLAVTSLRLWEGLPFDGKKSPADWQSGARKVSDLEHTNAISNYVAHYHVLQKLSEISAFRAETLKMKPSVILHLPIDSMKDGSKDHYVVSIGMRGYGRYTF